MANPEHLTILKQGVEQWNKWTSEQRFDDDDPGIDLSGADLAGRDLTAVDLTRVNLRRANLSGAVLSNAKLHNVNEYPQASLREADLSKARLLRADAAMADLHGAILRGTSLGGADLNLADVSTADLNKADLNFANISYANLEGASLHGVNLELANLTGAKLGGADFSESVLSNSLFADVDLSAAKGLETIQHAGPSYIGIDTIYKSKGKIPDVFLRGCGVPDDMISYIKSIAGAIQYYTCFISYSTKDQAFADRLYADLQAKGVRCWFAPHDIKGGRKIHEQIDGAIRVHDKLLLILSEHSMASDWVGTEIANAREREAREKKQMLFPITIAPFEEVKQWKKFDADRGRIRRGRFGSITFRTSAGGSGMRRGTRRSLKSWWGR